MLEVIILYIVLTIASIWDIRTFKIPNALVFFAMVVGLSLSTYQNGLSGLGYAGVSMLIVFLVLLPLWLIQLMFAGDIKLLMAMASFLGWKMTLVISYQAVIIASIIFLFLIKPKRVLEMFKEFFYLIFYKIPLLSAGKRSKLQFSVPIFIAFILSVHNLLP